MNALFTTTVTAHGGRSGRIESEDGKLAASLTIPKELGGPGGDGTNPEQLFAAGYAACFESALRLVARKQRLALPDGTAITAQVSLVRSEAALYELSAVLTGHLPGLAPATARALMHAAHQVCPYSNATRGNIQVMLALDETVAPAAIAAA
jgi:lipoyl-dependent peroxiredoxin